MKYFFMQAQYYKLYFGAVGELNEDEVDVAIGKLNELYNFKNGELTLNTKTIYGRFGITISKMNVDEDIAMFSSIEECLNYATKYMTTNVYEDKKIMIDYLFNNKLSFLDTWSSMMRFYK